jgi:hypothetical protein
MLVGARQEKAFFANANANAKMIASAMMVV